MPKVIDEPLVRVQMRFYKKDKERLERLFKDNIGVNEAVRKIVRLGLNQAEAQIEKTIDEMLMEENEAELNE